METVIGSMKALLISCQSWDVVRIRKYEKILRRQDRNMLANKRSCTEFLFGPPGTASHIENSLSCTSTLPGCIITKDCNGAISETKDRRYFKINVCSWCLWMSWWYYRCERKLVQWLRLSQPRQFNYVQFVRCWLNIQFAESGQKARCDACAVNVQRWMQRIQRERPWWTHGHCTCQQRIVQLSGVGSDIMYRTCSDTR